VHLPVLLNLLFGWDSSMKWTVKRFLHLHCDRASWNASIPINTPIAVHAGLGHATSFAVESAVQSMEILLHLSTSISSLISILHV